MVLRIRPNLERNASLLGKTRLRMCSPEQPCSRILRTAGGADINHGNIMSRPESYRPDELWIILFEQDFKLATDWPAGVDCIVIHPMLAVLLEAVVRRRFAFRVLIHIAANPVQL